ncbi:MAG: hypothetical protein ACXAC6_10140 [Candidatus Hodarchaeales archaeon]
MKSNNWRISFSIILLIMIYTFSGCTNIITNFEFAGEKDPVVVPISTHTILILDVKLAVGSITLEMMPSGPNLVEVVNEVSIREGSGGTLADAEEVSFAEENSDNMKIQFDSNDVDIRVDYQYDITIKVARNISLQIDFLAATGEIEVSLMEDTLNISSFDLGTSTGSITVTLGDLLLSDSSPTIETSTGNQVIIFDNIQYVSSTLWLITASTGAIDVDFTDNPPSSNSSMTHSMDIGCSTGRIHILSDLHEDIGLNITTSVSTGSIDIPGTGDSYLSSDFDSSSLKYNFLLCTTTGDITFSFGG